MAILNLINTNWFVPSFVQTDQLSFDECCWSSKFGLDPDHPQTPNTNIKRFISEHWQKGAKFGLTWYHLLGSTWLSSSVSTHFTLHNSLVFVHPKMYFEFPLSTQSPSYKATYFHTTWACFLYDAPSILPWFFLEKPCLQMLGTVQMLTVTSKFSPHKNFCLSG